MLFTGYEIKYIKENLGGGPTETLQAGNTPYGISRLKVGTNNTSTKNFLVPPDEKKSAEVQSSVFTQKAITTTNYWQI